LHHLPGFLGIEILVKDRHGAGRNTRRRKDQKADDAQGDQAHHGQTDRPKTAQKLKYVIHEGPPRDGRPIGRRP
jgi:hypothetical protein